MIKYHYPSSCPDPASMLYSVSLPDCQLYSPLSPLPVSLPDYQSYVPLCPQSHPLQSLLPWLSLSLSPGSVTPSAPTATLLQGPSELVCLVLGFSSSDINITWLLDNVTELWNNNTSTTYRAPGGKFGIRSHLSLAHQDWTPGAVYTCRVTHTTQTLALNISKPGVCLSVHSILIQEHFPGASLFLASFTIVIEHYSLDSKLACFCNTFSMKISFFPFE